MAISFEDLTNIYVFGDSLSDTGNALVLSSNEIPSPPYFEGRFSNGPVAVEFLVNKLNNANAALNLALAPSFLGGNNFALAGAGTGRNNSSSDDAGLDLPGLLDQIDIFDRADIADAQGLFFIWAGPNNYLDNLAGSNTDDPAVLVEQGVDNLRAGVETLMATGARQFVIPNMLNLGRLPTSATFQREATAIAIAFNSRLALSLDNLELETPDPDLEIVEVDLYGFTETIAQAPDRFGYTNTTDPLLTSVIEEQFLPDTPGFFFWDQFHPTTQAHERFGEAIFKTLTGEIAQPIFNDILGTDRPDLHFGTTAADNFDGLAGNDLLFGLAGSDRIEGWQGRDGLFGNSGDDILDGGEGDDIVWGGAGNDLGFGSAGRDKLFGNQGEDILIGDGDNDWLWGNGDDDYLLGGTGDDQLWGNAGDDILHGGDDHDYLIGGKGADKLIGGNGDDWGIGGRGDDLFVGGPGDDTWFGGLGLDVVQYQASLADFSYQGNPEQFQVVGANGTTTLKDIEFLAFTDGQVAVNALPFIMDEGGI
ncbi:SGNH/GDSL hydrolase family protein [Acaryochloris sp. IP29b_bin.148]|uniref:SGNH/GDSL hydrolase family protein n=1 Tax=Acaryochloris sp. IP29b_bin.148 TaxID=2969218 RepID=UPI002601C13C|nr:SGNH/GDSL hydrolase family protein [Acaryochloris sp. IP29b_bin.148]